jgi:hypothetical protein
MACKPEIPEALKAELTEKANELIETKLKPWKLDFDKAFKEKGFNYVLDMYTTWWRSYLYFCSKYRCPGPNAINEFFEARFARMEYVGYRRFNLAYMRHTGRWWEVYEGLTYDGGMFCCIALTNPTEVVITSADGQRHADVLERPWGYALYTVSLG